MNLVPDRPFPIRESIARGESGHGYVMRMAEANLLNGLSAVKAMLGKTRFAVLDAGDARQIAYWFGADVDHLALALGRMGTGEEPDVYELGGTTFTRSYFLNRGQPRVCVSCLQETGRSKLAWEVSANCACPAHGILLTAACPNCSAALRWDRPSIAQCRCGWFLSTARPEKPTLEEVDVAGWIEQAFTEDARRSSSTQLGRLLEPIGLDAGLHILAALSKVRLDQGDAVVELSPQVRRRNSLAHARAVIARAAANVEDLRTGLKGNWKAPSTAIELLVEACAASYAPADRQLALSVIANLRCKPTTSDWKSKFPQSSQLALF